jgi:hypothetical protein
MSGLSLESNLDSIPQEPAKEQKVAARVETDSQNAEKRTENKDQTENTRSLSRQTVHKRESTAKNSDIFCFLSYRS